MKGLADANRISLEGHGCNPPTDSVLIGGAKG